MFTQKMIIAERFGCRLSGLSLAVCQEERFERSIGDKLAGDERKKVLGYIKVFEDLLAFWCEPLAVRFLVSHVACWTLSIACAFLVLPW